MPKGCHANGGREWTNEEIARLKEAHAEGITYKDIAVELGRTLCGVTDKIKRLGLRRDKSRPGGNSVFDLESSVDFSYKKIEREQNLRSNERFIAAMIRAYGAQPSKPNQSPPKYARMARIPGYVPSRSSLE